MNFFHNLRVFSQGDCISHEPSTFQSFFCKCHYMPSFFFQFLFHFFQLRLFLICCQYFSLKPTCISADGLLCHVLHPQVFAFHYHCFPIASPVLWIMSEPIHLIYISSVTRFVVESCAALENWNVLMWANEELYICKDCKCPTTTPRPFSIQELLSDFECCLHAACFFNNAGARWFC